MRAYAGYPEYPRLFFSRVWQESSVLAEGKSHDRRSCEEKRAGQYKDFKDTENRTNKVSGTQAIVGLNHSQLVSHFEKSGFKFRGTL